MEMTVIRIPLHKFRFGRRFRGFPLHFVSHRLNASNFRMHAQNIFVEIMKII